jgi:hypothetical protein
MNRGNGVEGQLPEHRQKQYEAGVAMYQKLAAERDDFETKLHEANRKIAEMKVQVDSLNSVTSMMESSYKTAEIKMEERIARYQHERDEAVRRTATLEAILLNLHTILGNAIVLEGHDNADSQRPVD